MPDQVAESCSPDCFWRRPLACLNPRRKKMEIEVSDASLSWSRHKQRIEVEAHWDSVYILRTSLSKEALGAEA